MLIAHRRVLNDAQVHAAVTHSVAEERSRDNLERGSRFVHHVIRNHCSLTMVTSKSSQVLNQVLFRFECELGDASRIKTNEGEKEKRNEVTKMKILE